MLKRSKINIKSLYTLFIISIIAVAAVKLFFIKSEQHPKSEIMKKSVELSKEWFDIIIQEKAKRNIKSDAESIVKYKELLGNDFTEITTTLGSLESKELTTNPEFAAAITKLLLELIIDEDSKIGVIMSASFPALAVSTLASLQVVGCDVVMFSSLGASTYGANQPNATWIDMEKLLLQSGGLKYKSDIVSLGAENDNGEGLIEEGVSMLILAAKRNNVKLYLPHSIEESINYKTEHLIKSNIDLLINLGGNQSALGACPHASTIPNGYVQQFQSCSDHNRGIISRLNENGIPFINFLNIKDLALRYGLPLQPGTTYGDCSGIYYSESVNKFGVSLILILLSITFLISVKRTKNNSST
jgi:poly-gamma-glutamate system protein